MLIVFEYNVCCVNILIFKSADGVTKTWYQFLSQKFSTTEAEQGRPEREVIPDTTYQTGITDEEFRKGLAKIMNNKACGPDGIRYPG